MKLLMVEDDPMVTSSLRRGLSRIYIVDSADTGARGLYESSVNEYDVILLDLNLPDMSGLEVCRQLRGDNISTPIIVLSGEAATSEKVSLLDAGADDYMTKPFNFEELKARLRTIVRRGYDKPVANTFRVGDVIIDSSARTVSRAGRPVELRRKEFDLLEYLILHAGCAVTRQNIIDHVWDSGDEIWTNAVDVHIKYLRDKIDRPFPTPLITTVYGIGYRLETPNPGALTPNKKGGETNE